MSGQSNRIALQAYRGGVHYVRQHYILEFFFNIHPVSIMVQGVFQVFDNVVPIFQTDRKTYAAGVDPS